MRIGRGQGATTPRGWPSKSLILGPATGRAPLFANAGQGSVRVNVVMGEPVQNELLGDCRDDARPRADRDGGEH